MSDGPDVRPEDALQVAQRALAKANELERGASELESRLDDALEKLVGMELRLSAFDEDRAYDELTRDDKIGMVREAAFNRAVEGRGRTLDYSDIRDIVFDGEPSPAHCYDLMKWAAQARGFEHKTTASRNEHLYVDPDEAQRGYAFYSAKKDASEGAV